MLFPVLPCLVEVGSWIRDFGNIWDNFWYKFFGCKCPWTELDLHWYDTVACVLTFSASCKIFPWLMEWMKWTKNEYCFKMPWTELKPIGIDWNWYLIPEVTLGSLVDLACSERALRQCFNFGIRVVEIVETFETNLETCLEDSKTMFIFVHFSHSMNQENISHFWVAGNIPLLISDSRTHFILAYIMFVTSYFLTAAIF